MSDAVPIYRAPSVEYRYHGGVLEWRNPADDPDTWVIADISVEKVEGLYRLIHPVPNA